MAKKRAGSKAKKSRKAPKRAARKTPKRAAARKAPKRKLAPKARRSKATKAAPRIKVDIPAVERSAEVQPAPVPAPAPAPATPIPTPTVMTAVTAPVAPAPPPAAPPAAEVTKPTHLADADFDKFVKEHDLVLVDFWAPWCGPCRFIAPVVEELAQRHKGKLAVGKMNTDENTEIPPRYAIMAIPTLLVFKKGDLVDKIIGAVPKAEIERVLAKHF